MEYAKLSKQDLVATALKFEQELKNSQLQTTNAINIANYFGANLESIERLVNNAPNHKGKFLTTLWFLLSNASAIIELITSIKAIVAEWRAKIEELKAAQNVSQGS